MIDRSRLEAVDAEHEQERQQQSDQPPCRAGSSVWRPIALKTGITVSSGQTNSAVASAMPGSMTSENSKISLAIGRSMSLDQCISVPPSRPRLLGEIKPALACEKIAHLDQTQHVIIVGTDIINIEEKCMIAVSGQNR
jgi:hypothetical protein